MKLAWDSKARQQQAAGRMAERPRSSDLYHTSRWTRLSRAYRAEHPLCAECLKAGVIKEAEVVDHKTPWPVCGTDGFFDRANLQSLCQTCNIAKGNTDKRIIREWRKTHPEIL